MAAMNSLDKWRDYFRTCRSGDIFDIIEHGIKVAACDYQKEFRLRRDRIAETLFSAKLSKCVGCDHVELFVAVDDEVENGKFEGGMVKERKVESGVDDNNDDDDDDDDDDHNVKEMESNYSYRDAEALTDEIEEESQIFREVLRIKEIVENSEDESESLLFESLRRLELMTLSVEVLKGTEIGKAVNALRKHGSKDIRQLARTLIEGWKAAVDEWMTATATIAGGAEGGTPESVNPSVVDEEEGLPSPPLDDLTFFATQPTSMEFSQFFDGLDDDLNPQNNEEINGNHETVVKPRVESRKAQNTAMQRHRLSIESVTPLKDKKVEQIKKSEATIRKQTTLSKPDKPSIPGSGPGRPMKPSLEQKVHCETKLQQKSEKVTIHRPPVSQQNKPRSSDVTEEQLKLEATKRKLQERYQQAENAKRQRTVQVMELQDLPKQGLGHKNAHMKPGNHNRHWANGRR